MIIEDRVLIVVVRLNGIAHIPVAAINNRMGLLIYITMVTLHGYYDLITRVVARWVLRIDCTSVGLICSHATQI